MSLVKHAADPTLDHYFDSFRKDVIGHDARFNSPYGFKRIIYADWIASGRLYYPIERRLTEVVGPYVGNTHTETTVTGTSMTRAYSLAKKRIKKHVNAGDNNIIITTGSGMTGVVNKFQRILGLKVSEKMEPYLKLPDSMRPIVFVTHMEHHSNHTSWLETIADVECIQPDKEGKVDLNDFERLLKKYEKRWLKIAAVTSCSNVTGVFAPYHEIARMIHEAGGYCFVDFACSAPYVDIDMNPKDPLKKLDAIYFSPHKFLGGPGTPGVLVFDAKLYQNRVPDNPGGGTVLWTNPWGEHHFLEDIEAREDGGTPGFLQTIKAAMVMQVKDQMGVKNIKKREEFMVGKVMKKLRSLPGLHLLADHIEDRLGVISFYIEDMHYNLGVKLLNDRFGIQVRGGCSCAGTYGHYLLNVSRELSQQITCSIDQGDQTHKPGWIRLSLHPILTNAELDLILDAIEQLCVNHKEWGKDYVYHNQTNEFTHKSFEDEDNRRVEAWFNQF